MNEHHLKVPKSARYYTLGQNLSAARHFWVVCHGYGELAADFLRNFSSLETGQHFIVAPEGHSRFYTKGVSGQVGASWMTKEDRLQEIEDYIQYLNLLYKTLTSDIDLSDITVNVLGFSQGAATVSRWVQYGQCTPDNLILWAGLSPPDLDFEVDPEKLQSTQVWLLYGEEDQFYDQGRVAKQTQQLEAHDISYKFQTFEGKHEIKEDALHQLVKQF